MYQSSYISKIKKYNFQLTLSFEDIRKIKAQYAYATFSTVSHILTMTALLSQVTELRFRSAKAHVIKLLRYLQWRAHADIVLQGLTLKSIPRHNLKVLVCIDSAFATNDDKSVKLGFISLLSDKEK